MSEKVLTLTFGKAPDNRASDLRKLADQVDAGEIKELVAVFVEGGYIDYLWGASPLNSTAYTAMLHAQAIHKMREE